MKRLVLVLLVSVASLLGMLRIVSGATTTYALLTHDRVDEGGEPLTCVAFSPYVAGFDPNAEPHPPAALIDQLLDVIVRQTGFRCIMTYSVLNGLTHTFESARARGIKAIAILWLDTDSATNSLSISQGIQSAQTFSDTIIRLSCGSEVRTRHGVATATPIIQGCIDEVRQAHVPQPVTSIDTWWAWCNETWPCQPWSLAAQVDWIGVNIFPWWENKYSGLFPCTTAEEAADFNIARYQDVIARYPITEVVLTEFGWPAGPNGYSETNQHTGQQCGVASEENQYRIDADTLNKLRALGLSGVSFEAFREPWKASTEGPVGPYWGICDGTPPYACRQPYGTTWSVAQKQDVLEIGFGSGGDFPQYAALHLGSSYFRLTYAPTATFGTSAVLAPPFWSGGRYYQGAPVTASWQTDGLDLRLLTTGTQVLSGSTGSLTALSEIRLSPPAGDNIAARITVTTQISGSLALDANRPGEAFKPAMLSSMRVLPRLWDAKLAYAGALTLTLPVSGWIAQPPISTDTFGLVGGTSCWKVNAPTLEVRLGRPMDVTGWVTSSGDPDDDNVGWWAATDAVLSSWSYVLQASHAPGPPVRCTIYLPVVLRNRGSSVEGSESRVASSSLLPGVGR